MEEERTSNGAAWTILGLMVAAAAAGLGASGLGFDWRSAAMPATAAAGLVALSLAYRRRDPRLAATLVGVAHLVAFTAVGALLSYMAATLNRPLWDETLHAWDRALGLDWRAYLDFVNARPSLGFVFTLAYASLLPQMVIATVALGFFRSSASCRTFVLAVMLSGLAAILFSAAMPAYAMFVHLGLEPADYPNLSPAAGFVHVRDLDALRDGTLRTITLTGAEGIITFPSYHASLAAIFAWAFWQVRRLRWPGLVLNVLVVAATPIDGGHYFVDVIAGLAIAALSVAAASRLARGLRLAPLRRTALRADEPRPAC